MSKIGEPKVRFLSLSSLQTSRGGLLLAESALFTLLSLLIVADSGARRGAIAFFSSLYAFCHLADLRFPFFHSASRIKRELSGPTRAFPQTSRRRPPLSSNILALLLDASTIGTRAEDLSPSTGIPPAVLKQALYDSKGTSPRTMQPLPSSRRRRSAPYQQGHRA